MIIEWNKSTFTNLTATVISLLAFVFPSLAWILWPVGSYAFSGSITTWVSLVMLFEKVPFLYGTGVIPARFDDFRKGIREMILTEFFTVDKLTAFLSTGPASGVAAVGNGDSVEPSIAPDLDYDRMYEALIETIQHSPFGSMLAMMGGVSALEPLRDPIKERIRLTVSELMKSGALGLDPQALRGKIEIVVDRRLEELTPQAVKEIMENMIREHLGWLVVWGGVLGGLIGLVAAFIPSAT